MRRRSASISVSLFPFLAVLLCAMGALILLLLVLTRQIREEALRVAAVATPARSPKVSVVEEELPLTVPTVVVTVVPPTPPPLPDPNVALRERLAVMTTGFEAAARDMERLRLDLVQRRERVRSADTKLSSLQFDIAAVRQRVAAREVERRDRDSERVRLLGDVCDAKAALAAARDDAEFAEPEVSILPYDGRSGTARRPIFIECTGDAIRFVPEDVVLSASDLEGFLPDYNPLLAGTAALCEHWRDGKSTRPYVLLLVREDGVAAYYAARTLLRSLGGDTGYELITDDLKLALPEVDPAAREVCRDAVRDLMRQRQPLLAETVRQGVHEPLFPTGRFEVDPLEHDPTRPPDLRLPGRGFGEARSSRNEPDVPPEAALRPRRLNMTPFSPSASPAGAIARRLAQEDPKPTSGPPSSQTEGAKALDRTLAAGWPDFLTAGGPQRRWGLSAPSANISLERPLAVEVTGDEIIVGGQPPIPIGDDGVTGPTAHAIIDSIQREANSWGRAPGQFYWSPRLMATIRPGGTRHFDQLSRHVAATGLRTTGDIALESAVPAFLELEHAATAP